MLRTVWFCWDSFLKVCNMEEDICPVLYKISNVINSSDHMFGYELSKLYFRYNLQTAQKLFVKKISVIVEFQKNNLHKYMHATVIQKDANISQFSMSPHTVFFRCKFKKFNVRKPKFKFRKIFFFLNNHLKVYWYFFVVFKYLCNFQQFLITSLSLAFISITLKTIPPTFVFFIKLQFEWTFKNLLNLLFLFFFLVSQSH